MTMKRHTLSTYRLIANIISFTHPIEALKATLERFKYWEQLVYHSSVHLLLPTIYKRLHDKKMLNLLPEDLVTYIESIYQINYNRNLEILEQLKNLHAILASAGINHLFLKGSAMLIKASNSHQLERMVGDIDVLIEKTQLQQAFELLQQHGYTKNIGFAYEVQNFRHLDRQISQKGLAAVELHDELIRHPKQHLVNAKEMLEQRIIYNELPIPNDYFMGLHSVMAFQVNDFGYYYRNISFKTLYDTLVLKVPQNSTLIETLQNQHYGQYFLTWSQAFCKDYEALGINLKQKIRLRHLYLRMSLTWYGNLYHKTKTILEFIIHRLHLWFHNASYRNHILKHKFKPF